MYELTDKIILVTGGTSGIGRGAALVLARHGATVVITGRRDTGEEIAAEIQKEAGSGKVQFYKCDHSNKEQVEALHERIETELGPMEAAFNNAGGEVAFGRVGDIPIEEFEATFRLHFDAVFWCMRHQLKYMTNRKHGIIINNTSVLSPQCLPSTPAYCSAKAGLDSLIRSAAVEYAKDGIRVVGVAPALVRTGASEEFLNKAGEVPLTRSPTGTLVTSEQVGNVVAFLASPLSSGITGSVITVDNGVQAVSSIM